MDKLNDLVFPDFIANLHEQLPQPLNRFASIILLENVRYADEYLLAICIILLTLAIIQLKAFARPPPVPLKKLPKRPALSIQFKPDDPVTTNIINMIKDGGGQLVPALQGTTSVTTGSIASEKASITKKASFVERIDFVSKRLFGPKTQKQQQTDGLPIEEEDDDVDVDVDSGDDEFHEPPLVTRTGPKIGFNNVVQVETVAHDDNEDNYSHGTTKEETSETPFMYFQDLPDSFAPLLSSSQMELISQQLTADLIHAVQVEAGVRLNPGRHEIPLDKDRSRPQLLLVVPETGCRLSAVAVVGSDSLSNDEDMDVNISTMKRSKPMVKHAGLVLDPPLPLSNVAPTLIHFPTLFEDKYILPILRSIQFVRFIVDFIVSISSFLEKCLWILESHCQIHLSKVRITPIYKGRTKKEQVDMTDDDINNNNKKNKKTKKESSSPEWRLQLAFSGHLLLFGWIPFPFISVTLPTFIIPQPHALLDYLLSKQPLASARLRRENIAEEKIAIAITNTAQAWNADLKLIATPPAVGVDVTLPGGVSVAMEMGLWRDHQAGRNRENEQHKHHHQKTTAGTNNTGQRTIPFDESGSVNSMSSWTTRNEAVSRRTPYSMAHVTPFDVNDLVPWEIELSCKGSISHEKMSFHIIKFAARHESLNPIGTMMPVQTSNFAVKGSFAVWKIQPGKKPNSDANSSRQTNSTPIPRRRERSLVRSSSSGHPELEGEDSPSVAAILLFPDETMSFQNDLRMLQYDYVFKVFDDSKIDAITLSVGATHPMLNGGTMITTIFDSIYAFGSFMAREDSVLDPIERRRKRNVLRHLPATDFTFGIQNVFIPPESESYSDDGLTLYVPQLEGGRMMIRLLGGMDIGSDAMSMGSNVSTTEVVSEGIKLIADFEIPAIVLNAETTVKEFPELDIHEGVKLHTLLNGVIGGSAKAHLRPQNLTVPLSTMGPNVFNPLEAYEIDFSGSSLSMKMKEFSNTLGHRRVMFPSESTFQIKVIQSVVDMGFEGKTECDLFWDFQGLSPILQVTAPGVSPADAPPDEKEQVSLLVSPLRQGCFSLIVSSVGGISITKAATSRDDKEGLYDWKFFNALVSPDEESFGRIVDVLHDKRTMDKLLQIVKVVNADLHRICRYSLQQVWRAKEILDQEGVSDPRHAIPMYNMSRLIALFLTGDVKQVDTILPIVKRVVDGDGLDVVRVKDLLREHLSHYDTYAPEFDRAVRFLAVAFGPVSVSQPYVEDHVCPLALVPHHAAAFENIPSANELYQTLLDKPQLPLDPSFSSLVSRVAPYLTFKQVQYILEVRAPTDWKPSDLRRIRYVYSIKRKVLEIAESYGGLSFLPQSFYLSVFLGEATRTSLRASKSSQISQRMNRNGAAKRKTSSRRRSGTSSKLDKNKVSNNTTLNRLRRRHIHHPTTMDPLAESADEDQTPAGRVASYHKFGEVQNINVPGNLIFRSGGSSEREGYQLGDSLLGPQDVAILLQAGLTSVMKSSTVVQLNQRMLLDLICSQPRSFAVAVLAEIGTDPRRLTSALMALLELDQTSFKRSHQIDMHHLLESWLPELKIPRREDHMAGGRWARQGYYDALRAVAKSICEDAEPYFALRSHLQQVRHHTESDPLPQPREELNDSQGLDLSERKEGMTSKLGMAIEDAISCIAAADEAGNNILELLFTDEEAAKNSDEYATAVSLYYRAFDACAKVIELDKHAFYAPWLSAFYKRNYDALHIYSLYDNVRNDVDRVRYWLGALLRGAKKADEGSKVENKKDGQEREWIDLPARHVEVPEDVFDDPDNALDQVLIDAILDSIIYEKSDRERLRMDPLVRLLIPNPPGKYDFVIISAAGVITEGKQGTELKDAFERLEKERGVKVIRADTATARSLEYNAGKVEEAIELAVKLKKPYGLLGYSQGCANALLTESLLLSGTPKQQQLLSKANGGLVTRQLLFSASNGSFHGPATEKKMIQLISMCEDFFKSQAGYFSRAFSTTILESLNGLLDSAPFHKVMGGAQSFLPEGCREFWRESQHLSDVPTCTLRGVMEKHTTPESLEMLSNLLAKQSGSPLHDSQVHVFDAVGYPVYHLNRNGRMLKYCAVGDGSVQRTHHWSPLHYEVLFVQTPKDVEMASFDCAKDRHIFPWVETNRRFGFIKLLPEESVEGCLKAGVHPSKLLSTKNNDKKKQEQNNSTQT